MAVLEGVSFSVGRAAYLLGQQADEITPRDNALELRLEQMIAGAKQVLAEVVPDGWANSDPQEIGLANVCLTLLLQAWWNRPGGFARAEIGIDFLRISGVTAMLEGSEVHMGGVVGD